MTITNELKTALEAHAPKFIDWYAGQVRSLLAAMIQRHGPALRGVYNDYDYTYMPIIHKVTDRDDGNSFNRPYLLNEEKLNAYATKSANELVTAWIGKIEQKVGELDSPEVHHVTGYAYLITGTRDGHAVRIDQNMILNVSKHGKLFNQFPARITVDGKKTSAAAYAKMFQQ
jgi:hypothetical protein